MKYKTLVFR